MAELESVIADEPEYLAHAAQQLRDAREAARELNTTAYTWTTVAPDGSIVHTEDKLSQ